MQEIQGVIERYIAAWNEADPGRRRQLVDSLWAPDGRYTDPLADAQGLDAIDATIAAVQSQFPHFRFRLAGPVDGHGNQCRFTWELGPEGSDGLVAGSDVAVLAGDGRVQTVLGFLDRVPPAP